jgi:hypothetical protein
MTINATEQFRHKCEVRDLIAKTRRNGKAWIQTYCEGDGKTCKPWKRWAGSALEADFWQQLRAGNTGQAGEWIEATTKKETA